MSAKPKPLHQLGQLFVACETYIVHNHKVLMHKRAMDKKKFPGYWIGPGGHVDEGEDVLSAAIREVKEETGVTLSPKHIKLKVLSFHHHLDRHEIWVEYLFRATISSSQPIKDTHEGISEWIPIPRLLRMRRVFPPAKFYFDHILNDHPGILYASSQWKNAKLHKVLSQVVDQDF